MVTRRLVALTAAAMIVLAACSSTGSSPAASSGAGGSAAAIRLQGRRLVEQLLAGALEEGRRAGHAEGHRGRRWLVHPG